MHYLSHLTSCRPQAGRPDLGDGSKWPSGRPLQEEGLGHARQENGRQLGSQKLSPSQRHLGRGMGRGRA